MILRPHVYLAEGSDPIPLSKEISFKILLFGPTMRVGGRWRNSWGLMESPVAPGTWTEMLVWCVDTYDFRCHPLFSAPKLSELYRELSLRIVGQPEMLMLTMDGS